MNAVLMKHYWIIGVGTSGRLRGAGHVARVGVHYTTSCNTQSSAPEDG